MPSPANGPPSPASPGCLESHSQVDAALIAAALLMGVSGAPHCAAMCGAPCALVAGGESKALAALQLGRLVGYSAAGALAAASIASLGTVGNAAPVLQPIWTLAQVAALALGVWLLWKAKAPGWSWTTMPRVLAATSTRPVVWFRGLPAPARAGAAGAFWFMIPCGLLQSALLVSALASSPAAGAAVMAAFATTSALGLWLAPRLWMRLRRGGQAERMASWSVRLSGLLLAASAVFALWHGLGSALCNSIASF
jgi:sulfite exporter TauE/SafE